MAHVIVLSVVLIIWSILVSDLFRRLEYDLNDLFGCVGLKPRYEELVVKSALTRKLEKAFCHVDL